MNVNLLGICVGNSRTRLGAFVGGKLTETFAIENDQVQARLPEALEQTFTPLRATDNPAILLTWTNPVLGEQVMQRTGQVLDREVHRVERDLSIPIGRQLDREAIVGEDRLLNAAAAYDVLKQACVVVDAGTAMTVDYVDGAGTFHGGAITPGARMMLDSLHGHIPTLPEVELAIPMESIGHNTVQAILTGVYQGMRGMVRQLVESYAEVAGSFPLVVATGGDADLLFRDWELVDRVVPDLTLMGLAVTLRTSLEQST